MAKKMDFGGLNTQEEDSRSTQKSSTSFGSNTQRVYDTKVFKGVDTLKFEKDKTYIVKFVPYEVDATHPKVMQGKMKSGQAAYVLDYTQHAVGPNKTLVLCPKGTFGKACPICDKYFDLRQDDPKSEEAKALKSSRRVMYNVVVLKSNDSKCEADPSKVRILQASQYLFEAPLLDELKKGDGDEIESYHISDLCVGADGENKALKIMTSENSVGDFKCINFSFQIVSNKIELDDDALLEQAVPLHKALITLSPKELEGLLYGDEVSDSDTEDDDEPVKKSNDDDEDEDDDEDVPVKKKSAPVEDDDDEDEDEPKPKKAKKCGVCPSGFEFGIDTGMEDACDDCECYKECRAEKKRLRELKANED